MIINDLDDYYIVFDTKNRNTELDTLVINIFSCTFSEKYFLSFVIPPFHLDVVIILIFSNLSKVELGWNYRWNFM